MMDALGYVCPDDDVMMITETKTVMMYFQKYKKYKKRWKDFGLVW